MKKMIRVGKYDYKTKTCPEIPNFVNIIIHTTGDLSPYTMKDSKGQIMENFWQFHKIWKTVSQQNQTISRFDSRPRWQWPAETHFKDDQITEEYIKWRQAGLSHPRWVRYPNGFKNHSQVLGSWYKNRLIGIVEARRQIYFKKYREIAITTEQFKTLKQMLNDGINIQIVEVDGPNYLESYPYNKCVDNSLVMNEKRLRALIENTDHAFGHGFALAACLLDVDLTE